MYTLTCYGTLLLIIAVLLPSNTQSQLLTTMRKMSFENILGKGENAINQYFLLFSQCFKLYYEEKLTFYATFKLSSANAFNLVQTKI